MDLGSHSLKGYIMARKFTRKIEQVEGKGFEKVGDSYEGTLRGTKVVKITDKDGDRDAHLYTLEPDPDEKTGEVQKAFGVWGSPLLDDLMSQVEEGTYIRITMTGLRPPKRRGFSPMKIFMVEPAE